MGQPLSFQEVLALLTEDELLGEYDWHRHRGKMHRRAGRYGLYWWHQLQAGQICDQLGVMYGSPTASPEQLALEVVPRSAPDGRETPSQLAQRLHAKAVGSSGRLRTE